MSLHLETLTPPPMLCYCIVVMSDQPTDMTPLPKRIMYNGQNLLPEVYDEPDLIDFCAKAASLTVIQTKVLIALSDNFMSDENKTDRQIAIELGIHYNTVAKCRKNPRFTRVLAAIIMQLTISNVDKYIKGIEKHGEKSFKAYELLLRYTGLYIPTEQRLGVSAQSSIMTETDVDLEEMIDEFFRRLHDLGWNAQRVVDRFLSSVK